MKIFKTVLRVVLIVLGVIVLFVGGFLAYLTATEYSPESVEELTVSGEGSGALPLGKQVNILSWNTGYSGLGENEDFFMDGGSGVKPSLENFEKYFAGVGETLKTSGADIFMLQEVDTDSSHAYHSDQVSAFASGSSAFALNYCCPYVPYPFPVTIGEVNCGLLTYTSYDIASAQRISLPCPFSWPLRIANLKRCMMPVYMPIEGSDKMLVMVNVHLEAYDDGEGKLAQTQALISFIDSEYSKGNYVIVGGDFNQSFPGSLDVFPNTHAELWAPGVLDEAILPDGWSFACDISYPSCRLLNQPYDPSDTEDTQFYVIDGFILSPNVELENVKTLPEEFKNSDHNPVLLSVNLK